MTKIMQLIYVLIISTNRGTFIKQNVLVYYTIKTQKSCCQTNTFYIFQLIVFICSYAWRFIIFIFSANAEVAIKIL